MEQKATLPKPTKMNVVWSRTGISMIRHGALHAGSAYDRKIVTYDFKYRDVPLMLAKGTKH